MKIILVSLLIATSAFATTVKIQKAKQCVKTSAREIFKITTKFEEYQNLPGAKYVMPVPGVGEIQLIDLVKSQARYLEQTEANVSAFAWFVFQPLNSQEADFYPRFLLKCTTKMTGETELDYSCKMETSKQHYVVDDFSAYLKIRDGICADGLTEISYGVVIEANDVEIEKTKTSALKPFGVLAPFIEPLFNVEVFLKSYFEYFYDSMLGTKR